MATMANVCLRSVFRGTQVFQARTLALSATVHKEGDWKMNDPLEHATGVEKFELLAKQAGNDNPFDTYVIKPDAGTGISAKRPIAVPSMEDSRMVGCCCEDDYGEVVWFRLEKGGVQKCDCGFHFKLIDYDPLDPRIKPKFGKGFGSGLSKYY